MTKMALGLEIPVLNLDKGIRFYETVFGWNIDKEKYPGKGLVILNEYNTIMFFETTKSRSKGLNVVLGVEDIDAVIQRTKDNEGKIVKEKTGMGSEGFFAVIQDCFGNELSILDEPSN